MKKIEDNNALVFIVDVKANKHQIKQAVKKLYDIHMAKVNTLIRPHDFIYFGKINRNGLFSYPKVKQIPAHRSWRCCEITADGNAGLLGRSGEDSIHPHPTTGDLPSWPSCEKSPGVWQRGQVGPPRYSMRGCHLPSHESGPEKGHSKAVFPLLGAPLLQTQDLQQRLGLSGCRILNFHCSQGSLLTRKRNELQVEMEQWERPGSAGDMQAQAHGGVGSGAPPWPWSSPDVSSAHFPCSPLLPGLPGFVLAPRSCSNPEVQLPMPGPLEEESGPSWVSTAAPKSDGSDRSSLVVET
eukprot:bmy_21645T0